MLRSVFVLNKIIYVKKLSLWIYFKMTKYRIPKELLDRLSGIKKITKGGQKTVFEAYHWTTPANIDT